MILFEQGRIEEGNPIMEFLLVSDAFLFSVVKILLVYFGVGVLYHYRRLSISYYASVSMLFFYMTVIVKHIWIIKFNTV